MSTTTPLPPTSAALTIVDVLAVRGFLPHRYPMLMLDKVEIHVSGQLAVGVKNVTINEPFFSGHFPEKPIMPGVLIIEAMAQAAAVAVVQPLPANPNRQVYFMGIEEARFRKPVLPGDTLRLMVEKVQNRKTVWKFQGTAFVDGVVTSEALFTAMIAE